MSITARDLIASWKEKEANYTLPAFLGASGLLSAGAGAAGAMSGNREEAALAGFGRGVSTPILGMGAGALLGTAGTVLPALVTSKVMKTPLKPGALRELGFRGSTTGALYGLLAGVPTAAAQSYLKASKLPSREALETAHEENLSRIRLEAKINGMTTKEDVKRVSQQSDDLGFSGGTNDVYDFMEYVYDTLPES